MNDALLPGEKVLATRPANLMFGFDDVKLPEGRKVIGPASALELTLRALSGLAKARAIGGKVHITTYRVYFVANRLNSTRGTCSIFHPTIVFDEPVTGAFAGQWVVKTVTSSHRFAVRDPKELSALLRQTREKPLDVAALREHVSANPDKVGQGIAPYWGRKDLQKVVEAKEASSLQLVALVNALELFTE
jgi:hypothetical protein